jgi:hypothetical protein
LKEICKETGEIEMRKEHIVTMRFIIPSIGNNCKEIQEDIPESKAKHISLAIYGIIMEKRRCRRACEKKPTILNATMEISYSGNSYSEDFEIPSNVRSKVIITVCKIINE